ncbi:hypothetical protein GCM10027594_28170 [Hymenobacter agri]
MRGFINYRGWERNPRTIAFKPDLLAPAQLFRPLDINGFSVSNERYAGAKVSVEDSPQDLDKLSTTATPSYRADTVFLRALVAGPKSLYQYKPAKGNRTYFYIQQNGTFDLLVYKRYKQPGDGPVVVQNNNTYQNQLALYLADCSSMERQLQETHYYTSSLQRVLANYYACTSRPAAFQLRKKTSHQLGVLAGVTRTNLSFSDVKNPDYPTLDSYNQVGPTAGLYYYIPLPGNLGHFSFNNDLLFSSFKGSGSREDFTPTASTYRTTSFSLELAYLKLNTLLRFTQPLGAGAIFINAGMSNGYAIVAKSEKVLREKFYSSEYTSTSEAYPDPRRYEQGFVAGVGAGFKKISAEARYEYSNGFLDYQRLGSAFKRYSLLVGYRLH